MSPFFEPTYLIAILIALSVHEWAHAFTAYKLGDPTAKHEGRLTLNPLAHLDPIGTIMAVLVGFGWAKPVPVDPRYFNHPKRDMALVAIAGPVSNLILAWLSFFLLIAITGHGVGNSFMSLLQQPEYGNPATVMLAKFCHSMIGINLALMAFNLLPVPPLDGSRVVQMFVPLRHEETYWRYMQQGQFLLIILLLIDMQFPILSIWVFGIIGPILQVMNAVANFIT